MSGRDFWLEPQPRAAHTNWIWIKVGGELQWLGIKQINVTPVGTKPKTNEKRSNVKRVFIWWEIWFGGGNRYSSSAERNANKACEFGVYFRPKTNLLHDIILKLIWQRIPRETKMNSFRERVILPRKSFRVNKLIWNFFFKLIRPLRINLIAISMLLNHKKESRSNISHKHIIKCRFAVRAVIEVSRKNIAYIVYLLKRLIFMRSISWSRIILAVV